MLARLSYTHTHKHTHTYIHTYKYIHIHTDGFRKSYMYIFSGAQNTCILKYVEVEFFTITVLFRVRKYRRTEETKLNRINTKAKVKLSL